MYDKFFTKQWWFDRCLEGQSLFIPLNVILSLIFFLIIIFVLRLNKVNLLDLKKIKNLIVIIFILASTFFSMFFFSFLYGIFTCSAWSFWEPLQPAFELSGKINNFCKTNNRCPHSEDELHHIDSTLYKTLLKQTKTKYIYYPSTNDYIWYVRPSRYYVAFFSLDKFIIYKIPNLINVNHWDKFNATPLFPGKVSDLPK